MQVERQCRVNLRFNLTPLKALGDVTRRPAVRVFNMYRPDSNAS